MQIETNRFQKEVKKHGSDSFPLLISYERLSEYESGAFMWHWHPEIEITYVQTGHMHYQVNHNSYRLKAGDFLFANANVLHKGMMENMADCEYISLTFHPKLIYGFSQSEIFKKYVEPVIHNLAMPAVHIDFSMPWHKKYSELVYRIIALSKEQPPFFELDISGLLQSLWRLLLANALPEEESKPCDVAAALRVRNIAGYIEQNYMKKISLKDISESVHLCESECSRLFKKYMNISLFAFLQEYRIERSIELMDGDFSISEIAGSCGFSDSNYYSKVFKKIKGSSPKQYCKMMRAAVKNKNEMTVL